MPRETSLGIEALEALHYYVHDLERSRRFYVDRLSFVEEEVSGEELEARGRQRSILFRAGDCRVLCSTPLGEGGRAHRFLRKHPDGIGTLVFRVQDAEHALRRIEERGGNPISDIVEHRRAGGVLRTFSIATPFGSTTFRFVERRGYPTFVPGMARVQDASQGENPLGFTAFDHVTSNFETMSPALLWLEHVLGFEPYWDIAFHTRDVKPEGDGGSGLRSRVMWDPRSGVKLANNEPLRPFFKTSQINLFAEEQRGDGIQHVALSVGSIVDAVKALRDRGVEFLHTPESYYEILRERMKAWGIEHLAHSIEELAELGILVDGDAEGRYLMQIFLSDSASLYEDEKAGPFFFELIERRGAEGFGGGNFRALFESIEREQAGREVA